MSIAQRIRNMTKYNARYPEVPYLAAIVTREPHSSQWQYMNTLNTGGLPYRVHNWYSNALALASSTFEEKYLESMLYMEQNPNECPQGNHNYKGFIAALTFKTLTEREINARYDNFGTGKTRKLLYAVQDVLNIGPIVAQWQAIVYSDNPKEGEWASVDSTLASKYPRYFKGLDLLRAQLMYEQKLDVYGTMNIRDFLAVRAATDEKLTFAPLLEALDFDQKVAKLIVERGAQFTPWARDILRPESGQEPEASSGVFFYPEDFTPSEYDILMPWLAKVLEAWIKAADAFQVLDMSSKAVNALPCLTDAEFAGLTDAIEAPNWELRNPYIRALPQSYKAAIAPYVESTIRCIIHHYSLGVLARLLPDIARWVNDPKTKGVNLLSLNVADAARQARRYKETARRRADQYETKAVVFRTADNAYTFVELTTKDQLEREGQVQSHCVGNYCADVASGEIRILSMRDANNKRIATISINRANKIDQVFMSANRRLIGEAPRDAVVKMALYLKIGEFVGSAQEHQYEYDRQKALMAAQPEMAVLQGLWNLDLVGIHEFVNSFGERR